MSWSYFVWTLEWFRQSAKGTIAVHGNRRPKARACGWVHEEAHMVEREDLYRIVREEEPREGEGVIRDELWGEALEHRLHDRDVGRLEERGRGA
jgi:hypothetical protein